VEGETLSKDQLMQLVNAYLVAYSAKDSDGCARTFTPDGALFSPYGPPARGRKAIAATHLEWFDENEEDKHLEVLEFNENGESGSCLLGWSARVPDANGARGFRTVSGVSLCVLTLTGNEVLFSRLALVPDAA
jgi:ketosteroid isomerase-like protein